MKPEDSNMGKTGRIMHYLAPVGFEKVELIEAGSRKVATKDGGDLVHRMSRLGYVVIQFWGAHWFVG